MARTALVFAAAFSLLAGILQAAHGQDAAAPANAFNRLLKPPAKRNLPPTEDGIHDPASPGTPVLQAPLEAFGSLPKSNAGNRVNWVGAIETRKLRPVWSATDPKEEAQALDLDIVREVKGSMPDVVFSHAKHTALIDCGGCHPAIFEMQKGASKMSMASIMLGGSCGACHGRVAFPVSECRLCHSRVKAVAGAKP
jgi:c(7)-type cytochrome triheme protein